MNRHLVALVFGFGLSIAGFETNAFGVVASFRITNNSGAPRSDLHLDFSGTGGTAVLAVAVNAPGCAAPTVNPQGTPWDIVWLTACVDAGENITITITTNYPGQVSFSTGHWTPDDVPLAAGDVVAVGACCNLATNACTQRSDAECKALGFTFRGAGTPCGSDGTCIPTLSEWGVAVMAMLVLTAGTIVVMRRRAAATT